MSVVVFPYLAYQATTDARQVALLSLLPHSGWLALGPLAQRAVRTLGTWGSLIVGDALKGAAACLLAIASWQELPSLVQLLVAGCAMALASPLQDVAATVAVARTVPKEHLTRANSRIQVPVIAVLFLAAPPLGGALLGVAPWLPWSVAVVAHVSALMCISTAVHWRRGRSVVNAAASGPVADRGRRSDSAHVAASRDTSSNLPPARVAPTIRWLLAPVARDWTPLLALAVVVTALASGSAELMVFLAEETLNGGVLTLASITTSLAVGGLAATAAAPAISRRITFRAASLAATALIAAEFAVFASTANLAAVLVMALVGSAANSGWHVMVVAHVQAHAPPHRLPSIVSIYRTTAAWMTPTYALLAGTITHLHGLDSAFAFTALAAALCAVAAWTTTR
ncbi:hypothetical protein ASG94_17430 [Nocardioides sp. Soil805]|nr:hypothetical protein ASG94_17430 [Nocardioides sp. Soil805]